MFGNYQEPFSTMMSKIIRYFEKLEKAASPLTVRIESPVDIGSKERKSKYFVSCGKSRKKV